MITFEEVQPHHKFEICVQVRDNLGNPIGKTKCFSSDDADKVSDFYNKNTPYIWDGEAYKLRGGGKKNAAILPVAGQDPAA